MASYVLRKVARKLPGMVIKPIPKPRPKITEGFGKRNKVGEICKNAGYKSVLLITDKTLHSLGYHTSIEESLEKNGIKCTLFYEINSEPNIDIIDMGRKKVAESEAECIIALGGGSVLDSSKMIAAGAKLKHLNTHALLLKFLPVDGGTLPIISIPSTAGTGAEFTVGAVVTNHRGTKCATVIVGLNVTNVILDNELMINTPRSVTAACGIDALSHGLEGFVASVDSGKVNEKKSMECVKLVLENLPKVLDEPKNIVARQNMCRAAFLGGNAINEQLAGYVHAFAHSIGAMYHIPHGNAIALCLLPVMYFQKYSCTDRLSALARFCGLADEETDDISASDKLLEALKELIDKCGFEKPEFINVEDYHELAERISNDAINYSPPITMRNDEIFLLLDNIRGKSSHI
ncbi:MAG: iron-containing alcohol dehydrogenase [Lachnospiraceae bacterium]|nr:iron-containing alcohol dehydrogenase [Lachnospiraceae bacterium]